MARDNQRNLDAAHDDSYESDTYESAAPNESAAQVLRETSREEHKKRGECEESRETEQVGDGSSNAAASKSKATANVSRENELHASESHDGDLKWEPVELESVMQSERSEHSTQSAHPAQSVEELSFDGIATPPRWKFWQRRKNKRTNTPDASEARISRESHASSHLHENQADSVQTSSSATETAAASTVQFSSDTLASARNHAESVESVATTGASSSSDTATSSSVFSAATSTSTSSATSSATSSTATSRISVAANVSNTSMSAATAPASRTFINTPVGRVLTSLVAIALVLVVTCGWWLWDTRWRNITVNINGHALQVNVRTTVAELLAENKNFNVHAGRLLAVDGSVINENDGNIASVTVNGNAVKNADFASAQLPANSTLKVTNGADETEAYTVESESIAYDVNVDDAGGAIQYVAQAGKDGKRTVWVGKQSHKRVEKEVTEQPQTMIVKGANPHPQGKKVVALTFDDGPSEYSTKILDILKQKNVKATFFDLGNQALEFANIEKRMVDEGHQVASHTATHAYLPNLDRAALRSEITTGFDDIDKASGVKTTVLRAPYGAFTAQQWKDAEGLISMNVLWSVDTLDWKRPGADAIRKEAVQDAYNGAIILMHDGGGDRTQDVQALPGIIDDLKKQGYEFVTIDQLLAMVGIKPVV